MSIQDTLSQEFETRFDEAPAIIVRAPGRVNIIGEHTDYNDGFVLPMAIDRAVWIALRPRQDSVVNVYSVDFDQDYSFDLKDMQKGESSPVEYIKGVAWALQDAGYTLTGWEGVLQGDVPVAAGLSSSAALELATARVFASTSGIKWNAADMALLGQKAENQWVGMNCGIMDQMISASGKANTALLIDCRSLETQTAPLPPDTGVVVLDTSTKRGLVDSAYNERRSQCEAAAQHFGVTALRDVSIEDFEAQQHELNDMTQMRARHVITENNRTLQALGAMKSGDANLLGKLMNESHASLRDDFEVSSKALNAIVDCAQQHQACYGARMTGAGFGGCAVALVQADQTQVFAEYVELCYTKATGHTPRIYICMATNGAEVIKEV